MYCPDLPRLSAPNPTTWSRQPMRYVPFDDLGDTPHIIVDGDGNAHTTLTLSHWPGSPTPEPLKDDLSAQIVFHYLDRPEWHVPVSAVSNTHFDEDGLVGIYAL